MAQDPFKVDQIQIEPGLVGTRLIRRAADGSLEFLDSKVTGGITLSRLAGLQAVQNILVVGKAGAGATYTTIQAALDAIPSSSSQANPYFVLVGPGVYRETLNIVRDGVHIHGLGAVIQSAQEANPNGVGAYHTVVIQAAQGTVPRLVVLQDLEITNIHDNYACVRVTGGAGSQVAQAGVYLHNCNLKAVADGGNKTISADTANHIIVHGGTMRGSNSAALMVVANCASFRAIGVDRLPACQFTADGNVALPSEDILNYELHGCAGVAEDTTAAPGLTVTLSGISGFRMISCTGSPDVTVTGARTTKFFDAEIGDMLVDDNAVVYFIGGSHGVFSSSNGATLWYALQAGTAAFVDEPFKDVDLPARQPDTGYGVSLELDAAPADGAVPWVSNKNHIGFRINFGSNQTLGVRWTITRGF